MPDMLDIWNVQLGWGNSRASGYGHCLNRKDSGTWGNKKLVLRASWFCLGNKVPHSTFKCLWFYGLGGFKAKWMHTKTTGGGPRPKKTSTVGNGKSPKLCLEMTKWWGRKRDFQISNSWDLWMVVLLPCLWGLGRIYHFYSFHIGFGSGPATRIVCINTLGFQPLAKC